jgi:hypothetical protein
MKDGRPRLFFQYLTWTIGLAGMVYEAYRNSASGIWAFAGLVAIERAGNVREVLLRILSSSDDKDSKDGEKK